jgi:hypothetical protein
MAFLKKLQRLKQEWQKSPALLGPGKQTANGLEIERKLAKLSMPTVLPLNYETN